MIQIKGFTISSKSDIGLIRQGNEDNFYVPMGEQNIDAKGVLVGVADGMGGHNAGEVASQVAVETLGSYYYVEADGEPVDQVLAKVIKRANDRIMNLSNASLEMQGLGTTLTALLALENEAIVGHVGDCRIYLYREGSLRQITLDHSLVAEAVREGILTPEQARVHPQRNIITRALGTREELEVDSMVLPVEEDDLFMLSSDGLHGLVEDFELEEIMTAHRDDLDAMTDALIEAALEQGGSDNVTVVLLKYPVQGTGPASRNPTSSSGASPRDEEPSSSEHPVEGPADPPAGSPEPGSP